MSKSSVFSMKLSGHHHISVSRSQEISETCIILVSKVRQMQIFPFKLSETYLHCVGSVFLFEWLFFIIEIN